MTIAQHLRARKSFISLKEYAAAVGSHPQTIYKRLRKDPLAIPHVRDGAKIKFDPSMVADHLGAQQVG